MVTIVDTNAFLYDIVAPDRLTRAARVAMEKAELRDSIAICSITFWEVAMLESRRRIELHESVEQFLEHALQTRGYQVFSITPAIAATSAMDAWHDWDPADRIIGATAIEQKAKLVTSDQRMRDTKLLETIW